MTADGKCPELGTKFGLNTRKAKKSNARYYIARSMMNVDLSDGTIAFRFKYSAGTDKTIGYCYSNKWTAEYDPKKKSKYKPVLIISTFDNQAKNIRQIIDFIDEHRIEILNVCGHRNYIHDKKSFQEQVQYLLTNAFDVYDMRNLE